MMIRGHDTGCAIELECCQEPKAIANSSSVQLRGVLDHGLEQLIADYKDFKMDGANISNRRYSCVLFGKDGQLLAYTTAVSHEDISGIQELLRSRADDDRVVWIRE
jgi:hypothetical protein